MKAITAFNTGRLTDSMADMPEIITLKQLERRLVGLTPVNLDTCQWNRRVTALEVTFDSGEVVMVIPRIDDGGLSIAIQVRTEG